MTTEDALTYEDVVAIMKGLERFPAPMIDWFWQLIATELLEMRGPDD